MTWSGKDEGGAGNLGSLVVLLQKNEETPQHTIKPIHVVLLSDHEPFAVGSFKQFKCRSEVAAFLLKYVSLSIFYLLDNLQN